MVISGDLWRIACRITRRTRRSCRVNEIIVEAEQYNVPRELVQAVYGIETSFRPWWLRCVENGAMCLMMLKCLMVKGEFLNLTIGPYQIGCHLIADHHGHAYSRNGTKLVARSTLGLAIDIGKAMTFRGNLVIAVRRLSQLYLSALGTGLTHDEAIRFVGLQYNGTEWYGDLLLLICRQLTTRHTNALSECQVRPSSVP